MWKGPCQRFFQGSSALLQEDSDNSSLTLQTLLFWKKQGFFPQKKSKGFSLRGTPRILGKERENARKSKENRKTKKSKEIEKSKDWRVRVLICAPKFLRFLRLRCPSRTPEIASDFRDFALRFKGAMESRQRFAISSCNFWAPNPFFLRDFWRFGSVNAEIASDCDCAILVRWGDNSLHFFCWKHLRGNWGADPWSRKLPSLVGHPSPCRKRSPAKGVWPKKWRKKWQKHQESD